MYICHVARTIADSFTFGKKWWRDMQKEAHVSEGTNGFLTIATVIPDLL
jgi:hypothetical protein